MKQYLLFDMDGTLTDPMVGITSYVQYALEKFGIHVRYLKELIPFIGPPLAESFQKFYGFSKEEMCIRDSNRVTGGYNVKVRRKTKLFFGKRQSYSCFTTGSFPAVFA